jgi:hypothetical protein
MLGTSLLCFSLDIQTDISPTDSQHQAACTQDSRSTPLRTRGCFDPGHADLATIFRLAFPNDLRKGAQAHAPASRSAIPRSGAC